MKWLKEKTVIQYFLRKGGTLHCDKYWVMLPSRYQLIYLSLYDMDEIQRTGTKRNSLEIHGPRWKHKGNVHIVSYWGWPRSMAELDRIWDEIQETYGILAGVSWKSQGEVEWDLKRRKEEKQKMYNFERQIKRWETKSEQTNK